MADSTLASLATDGGAGLMTLGGALPTEPRRGIRPRPEDVLVRWLDPAKRGGIDRVATTIEETVTASSAGRVLVIVASTSPSAEMRSSKDQLHPLIVAEGLPGELFAGSGQEGSITSDSTHRDGIVTDLDVMPTIATFLGVDPPAEMTGSVIEIIPGPPPFELHERYLAQRRMYVPIGTAGGIYLAIVGLGAIAILALGRRVPQILRRVFGWGCLSVAALATGLLAAGHLPELTYATVIPFVALVTVFGTLAFAPLEHRDVLLIPAGIGVAVLAYFAVEAILSWTAALTPFVGGSELDGGRFYGLPNVFIGLLIGASLWIAHRLRTVAGFGLLVGVALFAGLPYLGANLGGGVSVFAAAGL
ncbi:MAG TPA: hypothetical protein VJ247_03140, partial [Gaiella sp.]|nr:hypothetical protein [Gaiella sp.]